MNGLAKRALIGLGLLLAAVLLGVILGNGLELLLDTFCGGPR